MKNTDLYMIMKNTYRQGDQLKTCEGKIFQNNIIKNGTRMTH